MKRLFSLLFACMFLMSSALACDSWCTGDHVQVVNCKEYISLREEPSTSAKVIDRIPLDGVAVWLRPHDETFSKVLYNNQVGYVMQDYLKNFFAVCENCIPQNLNDAELYNLQIFLTNFTEQGMLTPAGVLHGDSMTDAELVDFAAEHIWYNRQDKLEWGEHKNGNNVRLDKQHIPDICLKYFGRGPELFTSSRYEIDGDFLCWQETGGHVPYGFTLVNGVENMGDGRYRVSFCVYGMGMDWDERVYSMNERSLVHEMPEYFNTDVRPYGNAVVNVNGGSLMDRSTWTLERLAMDWL